MNDALSSLQALLGRIGAFFDIFDLSFLVSGATSLSALLFLYKVHAPQGSPDWMAGGYGGILLILACYVLGMLCFILGRLLRGNLLSLLSWERFSHRLLRRVRGALLEQNLQVKDEEQSVLAGCIRQLARDGSKESQAKEEATAGRLYALLWTQVRQQTELAPSHVLLNRYWVMTALCDGMVIGSLVWLAVLLSSWSRLGGSVSLLYGGIALSVLAAGLFLREADRYAAVQVNDLVATLAWERGRAVASQAQPAQPSSAPTVAAPAPSAAPIPAAALVPAAAPADASVSTASPVASSAAASATAEKGQPAQ